MPKNSRPGFFTAGWEGKSYAEIQKAQNEWDLLKAQEDLVKEMKNQNNYNSTSTTLSEEDIESMQDNIVFVNADDYPGVEKYMNKYNQQVASETPNLLKIVQEEKIIKEKIKQHQMSRPQAKANSLCGLIFVWVMIAVAGIAVLTTVNIDLLPALGGTVGVIFVISLIWAFLTNLYVTSKYGTEEQDEKELDKVVDKKVMSPTYKKFREFRMKHYNKKMETLIDMFTTDNIRNYYNSSININKGITDRISRDEIIAYGTEEDYMDYLRENFGE